LVGEELHIRRALINDADLVKSLSEITFADTFKDTCTEDDMAVYLQENYNLSLVKSELADPDDFYFLAFLDTKAVGYMRLKEDDSEVSLIRHYQSIELKRFYLIKEFQGYHIGEALMKYAFSFARERNYEMIWLGVWEFNHRARSFYRKHGFKETGSSHPFPIGNTPQTDIWLYRLLVKQ
jgi:diamine N-acetyltransferase